MSFPSLSTSSNSNPTKNKAMINSNSNLTIFVSVQECLPVPKRGMGEWRSERSQPATGVPLVRFGGGTQSSGELQLRNT